VRVDSPWINDEFINNFGFYFVILEVLLLMDEHSYV